MRYHVQIITENYPTVMRPCARCGAIRPFVPADEIRINAQKRLLDVWLIHRCQVCGRTWNMEIYARIAPERLDQVLYWRFQCNDAGLVREIAFDAALHARCGAGLDMDGLRYRIEGEWPDLDALTEPVEVCITCDVMLGIKVSKLLQELFGLSRGRLSALIGAGAIVGQGGERLEKVKLGREIVIEIRPT